MNPAVYRRPDKPLRVTVNRRPDFPPVTSAPLPDIVTVDRATECHVTPPSVADYMARALGPYQGGRALEPSAGTGNLTAALIRAGYPPAEIVQIERHNTLAARLDAGGPVINSCFLEYAAEARGGVEFPRVIMNPPFSDVRKHISVAVALLGRAGHAGRPALVALVPITFERDGFETLENLPDDTFSTAKVRTKIVRYFGN
jgi:hypothetical protein